MDHWTIPVLALRPAPSAIVSWWHTYSWHEMGPQCIIRLECLCGEGVIFPIWKGIRSRRVFSVLLTCNRIRLGQLPLSLSGERYPAVGNAGPQAFSSVCSTRPAIATPCKSTYSERPPPWRGALVKSSEVGPHL